MKKLSAKGQKWLKGFHIFFACMWVGAAVCLNMIIFFMTATDGMQLYGINISQKFIDDFVIIPGAIGVLLTGLLYSIYTNFGWFKHNWVIVKWIINLYGVIFGTFWLGPWLNSLPPIAKVQGLGALTDPTYTHNQTMLYWWGTFQAATLIFAVFISILKPWKRKKVSVKA